MTPQGCDVDACRRWNEEDKKKQKEGEKPTAEQPKTLVVLNRLEPEATPVFDSVIIQKIDDTLQNMSQKRSSSENPEKIVSNNEKALANRRDAFTERVKSAGRRQTFREDDESGFIKKLLDARNYPPESLGVGDIYDKLSLYVTNDPLITATGNVRWRATPAAVDIPHTHVYYSPDRLVEIGNLMGELGVGAASESSPATT